MIKKMATKASINDSEDEEYMEEEAEKEGRARNRTTRREGQLTVLKEQQGAGDQEPP